MTEQLLRVAVVGHTNTGKTSLMRTLMRDATFGEVSDRPAVTRHVEAARIPIDATRTLELFDTPGLEDSIGLLEHLDALGQHQKRTSIEHIKQFLGGELARDQYAQEAKALRQLLESDIALYVIDARDRVLAKYRDELEILSRCAKPIVPVLNFIGSPQAITPQWRAALAELNLHAVAEFDTVIFDQAGEIRLLEKMRTLLDAHQQAIDTLIQNRKQQREELVQSSSRLIAELLVDVAAHRAIVPTAEKEQAAPQIEQFKDQVRHREQQCVNDLLQLHRFRDEDYDAIALPIEGGQWGPDLFSPAALKQFGIRASSAAAAGALTGLAMDVMFGGISLGAWTALGASVGAAVGFGATHGRRLFDRLRGYSELRCDRATITLLLVRQTALARALLRRGHAAVTPIAIEKTNEADRTGIPDWTKTIIAALDEARINPQWSSLNDTLLPGQSSVSRSRLSGQLARDIEHQLTQ